MSNPFQLEDHLQALEAGYRSRVAFPDMDRETFLIWQRATREKVKSALGIAGVEIATGTAERVDERDRGEGLTQTKWSVQAEGRVPVPAYELATSGSREAKSVLLVLHGHNPSVQYCLGNYPDEATSERMRGKDNDYAEAPARAGWRVVAIEQQGFGERVTEDGAGLREKPPFTCRDLSLRYASLGKSTQGERVLDTLAVIGWLRSRGVERFAITGNSGGGTTQLWLGAVSEEVEVFVPGSTFSSLAACIYGVYHCDCNYVPGIRTILEAADWAALLAPRPLCFVQGDKDPLFPEWAARVEFERLAKAYELLGARDRLDLRFHDAEHAYNHELAQAFLREWFGPQT